MKMTDPHAIVDELVSILEDDFYALTYDKDSVNTDVGLFETVAVIEGDDRRWSRRNAVITKTPDDRYFRWEWEQGLTENQDSSGPAELDSEVKLTEVKPKEIIVKSLVWEEV